MNFARDAYQYRKLKFLSTYRLRKESKAERSAVIFVELENYSLITVGARGKETMEKNQQCGQNLPPAADQKKKTPQTEQKNCTLQET